MSYQWLKLDHDLPDDRKLRSFSINQKWGWICLLCAASQGDERGTIVDDREDLADYCGFDSAQDFEYFLDKLRQKGMIESTGIGHLKIANWEKRQHQKPSEKPEATRDRKRKQRAKSKDSRQEMSRDVTPQSRESHDTDTDTDKDKDKDTDKDTYPDPDRADRGKSADADVCVDDCLEVEILEPEPEQAEPLVQPNSSNSSLVASGTSGEGDSSGECSMISDKSMAVANFDDRARGILAPARIADTAAKILSMFNAGRPLYWKPLGVVQKPLRTKCEAHIKNYLQEGNNVDEAIALFEDDFKYAIVGLKTSDFHTSKDFQNGNIYWLFEKDRIYTYAGTGRSLSPTEQAIVAEKLVSDVTAKVIRDFHDGKVLSDTSVHFKRKLYRKMLDRKDPDAPTTEYLQENFPELLTELAKDK